MSKKNRKKKPLNYRRVKNWVLSLLGLFIIFMAISFSLARMAIKSVPDYISSIQNIISEQTGFKVEIGFLDAEINWLIPRLNLINVNVFNNSGKQHVLHIDEIDLSLDWMTTIKTRFPAVGEITLIGLNAQLGITKKSQLVFQDYVVDNNIDNTLSSNVKLDIANNFQFSENLKYYINNLNFKILNSELRLFDYRKQQKIRVLNNFNLLLLNSGNEHTFEIKADFPENYGKHLQMILNIEGDLFDYKNLNGQAYLSLEQFYVAPWLDDFWGELGVAANAGVNAQIWLDWQAQSITDVFSKFTLDDMAVHYLDASVKTWALQRLDGEVWWQKNANGWQLDIRNLESVRDGNIWPKPSAVNVVMLDAKGDLHIQADYLRIEGITYLAGMVASVYDAKDPWLALLHKYNPTGDISDFEATLPIDQPEKINLQAGFDRLGAALPDLEPSKVSNLSGSVEYADGHARLMLNSDNTELEFNKLFRDTMKFNKVHGVVDVFNQQDQWKILTDSLEVNSPHIETENRMLFTVSNNQQPFLDLTTKFKNGDAQYASLYLPVGIMGKKTVDWIDKGIKSGTVTQGGYQFYGNLSDMPFRGNEGVSLAFFELQNGHLHYLDNWPDIQGINATLRFENESMFIRGHSGNTFNSDIADAQVSINSFFSPVLEVKGNVDVDLSDIKRFLKSSIFKKGKKTYIENIDFIGNGSLDLNLFIPLSNNAITEWGGKLSVDDGQLTLLNENYKFNEVSGELSFANAFIESTPVTAKIDGRSINAKVETRQVDGKRDYHIDLDGYLNSKTVLSPAPSIKEYIDGDANWDVNIDIAGSKVESNELVSIEVSSDLKEVVSKIQGPLFKSIDQSMSLLMSIKVLENSVVSYDLVLPDNKHFKLDELDEYRYIYADTPGIKGTLKQYKAKGTLKPIEVDLDYFNIDDFLQGGENASNVIKNSALQDIIPSDLPAIKFKSKNMKWQKFNFQEVEFLTKPSQLGLAVDSFRITTPDYTVNGNGGWFKDWNKQNITSLTAIVDVKNLGTALKKLEITNDIKNIHGKIDLNLKWNDMPHNFSWVNMQGDGKLNLRKGTFKKIDAGVGRVLGLFNLKTLFSLDFANQVSKGFSFDKMKGTLAFKNGNVYTDDLVIESKAADVYMKGRLGIRDQTVKQLVKVRPHVGSTVAFGTTVVAGPVIGGLVYLFQKVFNPDALTEYEYSVNGDINDPVVTLLSVPKSKNSKQNEDDL